jgi:glucose/arabinose dehydrogenase
MREILFRRVFAPRFFSSRFAGYGWMYNIRFMRSLSCRKLLPGYFPFPKEVFGIPFFLRSITISVMIVALNGCYILQDSSGGGQTTFQPPRQIDPADVALPEGYRIEAVATDLTFPTGVTFDEEGNAYVIEAGYSYGEVWTTPRLLRIEPEGGFTVVAAGKDNGPWTGATYHKGAFYVAEGGELKGGRIVRITPDGNIAHLLVDLPSVGDHHTNGVVIGPDGWIYFAIGTATNSGVVGKDNFKFGWLKRFPAFHDIPCRDITLTGKNFSTENFLSPGAQENVETGAFVPFGKKTEKGEIIKGRIPCSGAVMRIRPEGGEPELVAWGFRNPFGLAFCPEGRLYVTENLYDIRGSRPVFGAGDLLRLVEPGVWYGWPDFHADTPLDEGEHYKVPLGHNPERLLAAYPNIPPKPVAVFGVHASANGFDFSRNSAFGYLGEAFVAEFGDQAPTTGKVLSPVGYKVVRVDVKNGTIADFAANKGKTTGPASWLDTGGLERPVAARFTPDGEALYIVDFGVMLDHGEGPMPVVETGVLWKVTRSSVK